MIDLLLCEQKNLIKIRFFVINMFNMMFTASCVKTNIFGAIGVDNLNFKFLTLKTKKLSSPESFLHNSGKGNEFQNSKMPKFFVYQHPLTPCKRLA